MELQVAASRFCLQRHPLSLKLFCSRPCQLNSSESFHFCVDMHWCGRMEIDILQKGVFVLETITASMCGCGIFSSGFCNGNQFHISGQIF